jgi:hypothetical protein
MGRNDKGRKKARKERKRSKLRDKEAQARADEERRLNPPPQEPINHSRLRQIFSTMSFRSHERGGTKPLADHVLGRNVKASTPEDLVEKTDEAFVDEALKQRPS